jgi:signal transduction histidine kinase
VNADRPLDGIRSIKVKLGLLVAASIVVAALVAQIGDRAGVPAWLTVPVTVAAALGVTQWLARGMTSPLREMTEAAAHMATGDYSRRVTATSADEVGELATAFNTMAADLADSDQQRRQLVATVSHELRTPLAAQQALLENLVDGVVTPDDVVLRTALAQAERLGSLVGDLLDLSRVDGGVVPLALAEVDVGDLVARAVAEASVAPRHDGRRVPRVVDVEPGLIVTADAARLAQVLANLLDNADRHSPPDGTVRISAGAAGADRWWLDVADDGPGIPAEDARRVFDRFGSGDDTGGGTGIGLAIASWVCELHGGSITVLPARAGSDGARIRATLPRHPDAGDASKAAVTGKAAVTSNDGRTINGGDADRAAPASPVSSPPSTPAPHLTSEEDPVPTPTAAAPSGPSSSPAPRHTAAVASPRPGLPPGPVIDGLFGDLWPEAGLGPQVRLLLGCLGVGLLAALVLPFHQLGLGLLLVLLAGGVLLWRSSLHRRTRWSRLTTAVCLGLASLVVLRAAEWLTVLAVLTGIVLAAVALADATGLLSQLAALAAWPLAAVRGLPLLGRTVTATSRLSILWPIVRTAAISVVALVVFGGLFASGDAIFGSWASALVPDVAWDSFVFRTFVGFVVGGALLAGCYVAINPPRTGRLTLPAGRPVARVWEWAVPVGLVIALFAGFVVAQAAALFGGHDYVQRTTGLTYAAYVHQGFGQLTVATVLTLATVALAVRKAPKEAPRERLALRVVVGTLCVLTLVVVGSALHRMDLYQQAYGFTVLRVVVDAFELWLGLLVVLVLAAGVRLSGWWLPRAALVSGALLLLLGGLANPEAWIAERNIARYEATGKLDVRYLESLGADAVPTILAGLPPEVLGCFTTKAPGATSVLDWNLEWNLGRVRAADALAAAAAEGNPFAGTCPPTLQP